MSSLADNLEQWIARKYPSGSPEILTITKDFKEQLIDRIRQLESRANEAKE